MKSEERKQTLPVCETENLSSASECTGLTPAAVQSPEEGETYASLYAIHQQKPVRKDAQHRQKKNDSQIQ